jgi:hypothetical protein
VEASFFSGCEDTRRFTDGFGTDRSPWDFFRVTDSEKLDPGSVNDKAVSIDRDVALEPSVDRVVFEEVSSVVKAEEGVIDGDDSGVIVENSGTADETSDTAESIDSELNWHDEIKMRFGFRAGLLLCTLCDARAIDLMRSIEGTPRMVEWRRALAGFSSKDLRSVSERSRFVSHDNSFDWLMRVRHNFFHTDDSDGCQHIGIWNPSVNRCSTNEGLTIPTGTSHAGE